MTKIFLAATLVFLALVTMTWRTPRAARAVADPRLSAHGTPYPFQTPPGFPAPHLPPDNPLTNEGVALGQTLFFERKLSGNDTQSCASCHDPKFAYSAGGHAVSIGIDGKAGTRHAPALVNLAWNTLFTWDGGKPRLRDQVLAPIQNPIEMHQTLAAAVAKLQADPKYPMLFASAFGDRTITSDRIGLAVEQYLETLVSGDSKFDRSLRGQAQLTPQEQRGLQLFTTRYDPTGRFVGADCARCHSGALFTDNDFHNNGLDSAFKDPGRGGITHNPADLGKFKTPSLRNLAVRAPFMHDGRMQGMKDVIDHYNMGIVQSGTLDQGLARQKGGGLRLAKPDADALVAFLMTLNDPKFTGTGTPPPPPGPPH